MFDIAGDGHPLQVAWTAKGSTNVFLALDRNGNGVIDNGTDLFGNFTMQPPSSNPNGFAALAVFDGTGSGVIDSSNPIHYQLLLWIDINHDGISQPNELFTLPQLGITSISVNYSHAKYVDQYGNQFQDKAPVVVQHGNVSNDFTVYDVFLMAMTAPPSVSDMVLPALPFNRCSIQ